mmetsp:Transcript_7457/g.15219  ORF Transcript_7457/g.15219 Transcript_7457/m.15219 type:complete len:486 (+) Transcript_7457:56-1513(+)
MAEQRKGPLRCPECGSTEIDHDTQRGDAACVECGHVLEENAIVAEVTFQEDTRGKSSIVGQHVRADGKPVMLGGMPGLTREATEVTLSHGRKKVWHMVSALRLTNHHADAAIRLFRLAVERNFHKGRRMGNVCCACLYVVCRLERTPHMLIDFSDVLETNLYALGTTFLKFSRLMNIELPIIDPSLYIHRFASKLEFGEKTHQVALTALRLVARMKRDWMSHGRRPSGLCGASLLVSARVHGFYRSLTDVVKVVRIGPSALRERLLEFDRTSTSSMTVRQIDEGGGDDGKVNSLHDDGQEPRDPPAYQRAKRKRVMMSQTGLTGVIENVEEALHEVETVLNCTELQELEIEGSTDVPFSPLTEPRKQISEKSGSSQHTAQLDKETLSDVDDDEVNDYLNSVDEVRVKERVWQSMNKDYLEQQERLEKIRVEDPEQYKRLRPWRVKHAKEKEKDTDENTKRPSSKVNYAVLDDLFAHEDKLPPTVS